MDASRSDCAATLPASCSANDNAGPAPGVTWIRSLMNWLARQQAARRHARDLAEMPDRQRADIGLPPQARGRLDIERLRMHGRY